MLKNPEEVGDLNSNHRDILEASEIAYQEVSSHLFRPNFRRPTPQGKLHRKSHCFIVNEAMGSEMVSRGYDPTLLHRQAGHRYPEPHAYQELESLDSKIIVDPTWQQFLGIWVRKRELPKVIVGTPEDILQFVVKAGINKRHLDFWRQDPQALLSDSRYKFEDGKWKLTDSFVNEDWQP